MLWSIRVRLTLAALLVVVVTLAVGGAALVWLLHSSLTDGLVNSATSEADNVGGLISQGSIPADLPVRSGTAVQVVNASGVVVASSNDLRGRTAVAVGAAPRRERTSRCRPACRCRVTTTTASPWPPLWQRPRET